MKTDEEHGCIGYGADSSHSGTVSKQNKLRAQAKEQLDGAPTYSQPRNQE